MSDCKYETWKARVTVVQQRRDVLFCPCAPCSLARRAWHMRTDDYRPKVKARLELLRAKPPEPPPPEAA